MNHIIYKDGRLATQAELATADGHRWLLQQLKMLYLYAASSVAFCYY